MYVSDPNPTDPLEALQAALSDGERSAGFEPFDIERFLVAMRRPQNN